MAAGAGFKVFNTGDVLSASDVNDYLMSQTVMVFANSTARSSAITLPQEGMISYLKDTNSTEYYSGSAWTAIGGGGGGYTPTLTLLNSGGTSLSGSTTTVSGISGKQWLYFYVVGASTSTSGSAAIAFQLNTDTGSNYLQAGLIDISGSVSGYGNTDTFFPIGLTAATAGTVSGYGQVWNANTTTPKPFMTFGSGSTRSYYDMGHYQGTSAISSISVTTTAGTFDAGTIYVYGA